MVRLASVSHSHPTELRVPQLHKAGHSQHSDSAKLAWEFCAARASGFGPRSWPLGLAIRRCRRLMALVLRAGRLGVADGMEWIRVTVLWRVKGSCLAFRFTKSDSTSPRADCDAVCGRAYRDCISWETHVLSLPSTCSHCEGRSKVRNPPRFQDVCPPDGGVDPSCKQTLKSNPLLCT